MPPSVSVVVPVYNQAERLRETVPAVLALENVDELIWVDDGSTDDSYSVIAKTIRTSGNDHQARVLQHPGNRGRAAARNTGWSQARGEVVFFLDADIRPHPEAARAHALAHRHASVIASLSNDTPEGLDPKDPYHAYLLSKPGPAAYGPGEPLPLRYLIVGYTAFKTDALRAVGGFDERIAYGEDLDLAWRLHQYRPNAFRFVPDAQVSQGDMGHLADRLAKLNAFGRELPQLFRRHEGLAEAAGLSSVASGPVRTALRTTAALTRPLVPVAPPSLRSRLIRLQLAAAVASGYSNALTSSAP